MFVARKYALRFKSKNYVRLIEFVVQTNVGSICGSIFYGLCM